MYVDKWYFFGIVLRIGGSWMAATRTEALHQNAEGLDIQAPNVILSSLANAQIEVAKAARGAIPAFAKAAEIIASRLKSGGKFAYTPMVSSGLMALVAAGADAAEKILEGTSQKLRPVLSAIEGSMGRNASVLKTEPAKGQQGD
ncbi:N-acetylmuramic acid 6-phosphate (MurNAc-6-P) etherase [Mesorhizobium robiniae]|uniref:N-acetylmuramic acid 6-phosphate (MurNAc-6-P) etherase n=1 Tax=Mesorhizobium robiniae TaxID=559315 RepID=A0ABV2GKX8_9HYPH